MAGLRLNEGDIERLGAAQSALLSPLCWDDADDWQLRANAAVRHLLGADHSLFGMPGKDGPAVTTGDTDPAFPQRLLDYYAGLDGGDYRFRDRCMEKMGRARRAAGSGAYHQDMLCTPEEVYSSPGYHEIFVPSGVTNLAGLSVPMAVGEATEFFAFEGRAATERSHRAYHLLRLLLPAFEAGVRVQQAIRTRRAALAATLDELGPPVAIYSAAGAMLHHTPALDELLSAEHEGESARLIAAVDAIARALGARLRRSGKTDDPILPEDPSSRISTHRAEYRLVGSYLPAELLGRAGILVQVERLGPILPAPADVRVRFGLTRREAEVAVLLAEGMSDSAVARHLTLSTHTARRYSERVLKKLGLHSRAAIAITLLRGSSPSPPG